MTTRHSRLRGLGLTGEAELLYRTILAEPRADVGSLVGLSGLTDSEMKAAHIELVDAGLAETDGDRLLPVDPRIGLRRLVSARQEGIDTAAAAIVDLARDYLDGSSRNTLTELVEGRQQMEATLRALIDSAEHEVAVLDTPPYSNANAVESTEQTSLNRGVAHRVVYAVEVLELPRQYDNIRRMASVGEQARVLPTVPMKLLIVDGARAFIPINTGVGVTRSGVLVHPSPVAAAMAALFESLWREALPLFQGGADIGGPLDPAERELLGLLASGVKDEAIARRLGLSLRTVSRRVNRLLDRLGAANRFQAGMQAARRGWLTE
ncbi:helix-turn-helix transcriptional regulator [Stackebrandtia soli]|uniref:helix-turn-helix transcriptional regulator n=1 Tax=Stackebrandtia soli TaxID=1892856 RepID=UPI0039EAA7A5